MKLNIGAKTVLYGAHCFVLHPLFVALAWKQLYGWPADVRLLVAFAVHDLGYLKENTPNLDGPEGERHVLYGGELMTRWFGKDWGDFTRNHSRYWAKKTGQPLSQLGPADKLACALEPDLLYLVRVILTNEIWEYLQEFCHGKYQQEQGAGLAPLLSAEQLAQQRLTPATWKAMQQWRSRSKTFLRDWAWAHREHAQAAPNQTLKPGATRP